MEPSKRCPWIVAVVGWLVLSAAAFEACSSTPKAGGDAGDAGRFQNLGASYDCSANDAGSFTCVVGQSYCEVFSGHGGGDGTTYSPSCTPIPSGSPCAATPSCACLCALHGGCDFPCTCDEHEGFTTLSCGQI